MADHAALARACKRADGASGAGVIGLFVISPAEWRAHDYAPAKVDLILRTLVELQRELAKLRIPLLIARAETPGEVAGIVSGMAVRHGCAAVHFNREYEVNERARDAATEVACAKAGVAVHRHTDQVLVEPGDVRTGGDTFYTIYSPFKRAMVKHLGETGVEEVATPAVQAETGIASDAVPGSVKGFVSTVPAERWPAGERAAARRLEMFCAEKLAAYKSERDFPARPATSELSPYLTVGAISPRKCLALAMEVNREAAGEKNALEAGMAGAVHWMSEVLWREFYIHIMVGFPRVCKHRAFQVATERIRWSDNDEHFEKWKSGCTGVPIVDAGMRQLKAEGWMHNRVRMIAAMYLTKDLFIDWRRGEKHFSDHLVDGFLASNNGGWQWSASTGTDAAPYFRIFNPISQSERFDAEGEYIRRWLPELRDVEGAAIHQPGRMPELLRSRLDYPERPLVDHAEAKERVLKAFGELKGK